MCECCSPGCKEEFKCSNFLLTHPQPELLVKSQWTMCGCSSIFYLIFRLVAAIGFIIMLLKDAIETTDGARYFIFLTNWSFLTLTADVILQFALAAYGFYVYRKTGKKWEKTFQSMPWYLKMEWVITNIGSTAAWVVTIAYWAILYKGGPIATNNFNVHGMNSIYVFINLWITAMPVRIYHVYHAWIMMSTFFIFSAVYQLGFDQQPVYSILDWKDGTFVAASVAVGLAFGLTTAVRLIYYGLYRLRLVISSCLDNDNDYAPEEEGKTHGSVTEGHRNPGYKAEGVV